VNSLFANVVAGLAQPLLNKRAIKNQLRSKSCQSGNRLSEFQKSILTAGKKFLMPSEYIPFRIQYIDLKQKELEL
jgi:hypothetical protein